MSTIDEQLDNPFWHALQTEHAWLAVSAARARRYPADVIPFAGLESNSCEAMLSLRGLLSEGESIYVAGEEPLACPGMEQTRQLPGLQMIYPEAAAPVASEVELQAPRVEKMGADDAPAMVALTDVAFPGYFRLRTYLLGEYYGIRPHGELLAMAGERIALPGYREISAVCTHPDHTGKGYAAQLIRHILAVHAGAGLRSVLHVAAQNDRAIALYERLGFVKRRSILFTQLQRSPL